MHENAFTAGKDYSLPKINLIGIFYEMLARFTQLILNSVFHIAVNVFRCSSQSK